MMLNSFINSMGSVSLVVVVESAQNLITANGDLKDFHIPSIVAVGAALGKNLSGRTLPLSSPPFLGVKFLLFLYCWGLRYKSSQVHILWEDHRNDLFINGFGMSFGGSQTLSLSECVLAGILMSAGGSKLKWWLDPTGAILVSIFALLYPNLMIGMSR